MKVTLACQTLSRSTAKAEMFLKDLKGENFSGREATIEHITMCDALFNAFNSQNLWASFKKVPLCRKNYSQWHPLLESRWGPHLLLLCCQKWLHYRSWLLTPGLLQTLVLFPWPPWPPSQGYLLLSPPTARTAAHDAVAYDAFVVTSDMCWLQCTVVTGEMGRGSRNKSSYWQPMPFDHAHWSRMPKRGSTQYHGPPCTVHK